MVLTAVGLARAGKPAGEIRSPVECFPGEPKQAHRPLELGRSELTLQIAPIFYLPDAKSPPLKAHSRFMKAPSVCGWRGLRRGGACLFG